MDNDLAERLSSSRKVANVSMEWSLLDCDLGVLGKDPDLMNWGRKKFEVSWSEWLGDSVGVGSVRDELDAVADLKNWGRKNLDTESAAESNRTKKLYILIRLY